MWRVPAWIAVILTAACSRESPKQTPVAEPQTPVFSLKITQFYAAPSVLHAGGGPVKLCYGVEGAKTLTLDPPVDRVWPSAARCMEVQPKTSTTYTLTADDGRGGKASQAVTVQVGPPAAKIIEVSVNTLTIRAGEAFPFCVRAMNVKRWLLSAGKWRAEPDSKGGCAVDYPKVTTTYTITAVGAMGEVDTERVTATVQ